MKKLSRKMIVLACILSILFTVEVFAASAKIKLNMSSVTITAGSSKTLKVIVTGNSKKVTWKSSNTSVATVNSNGKITGKKAGMATITAKANGKTAKCKVTVKTTLKEVSKAVNLKACDAAIKFGLKLYDTSSSYFYTQPGKKTGDDSSYMTCSKNDINKKGMWTFYLKDNKYSLYGAKIGMSKGTANNCLIKTGWKKTSDYTSPRNNTVGYDKGNYHIVFSFKNGILTSASFYNVNHSW